MNTLAAYYARRRAPKPEKKATNRDREQFKQMVEELREKLFPKQKEIKLQ